MLFYPKHNLLAAGAEEGFRLIAEVFLEQQAQTHGSAVSQGNQAGGRAGGGVEASRVGEGWGLGAVGDVAVIVDGISADGDAHLPEVGEAGGSQAFLPRRGQGRQQQSHEDGQDGDDHQQLDEREGTTR